VQSVEHQLNIAKVAEYTPETQHWQPSREIEIIREAIRRIGVFPDNHVVRVSAHTIGAAGPAGFANTSTVHATRAPEGSYVCPAPDQGNVCGECRACWNRKIKNVSYWLH